MSVWVIKSTSHRNLKIFVLIVEEGPDSSETQNFNVLILICGINIKLINLI